MTADIPASADVLIVGGAAIGSSVAFHLAADRSFSGRVVVVEKDPTYARSASALSAASIRQQYSSAVNVRISLHGIDFLRRVGEILAVDGERPAIDLHEGGYLYLATGDGAQILADNHRIQTAEGADILLLDAADLHARFPWLEIDDLVRGSFGRSGEGWFDGWGLMQAFRRKARALGVTYVAGEVVDLERETNRITAVRLADGTRIACGSVVNASGFEGRRVAAMAGVSIPVVPKKRFVFSWYCRAELPDFPLLIDPSGAWARPEGRPGPEGRLYIGSAGPAEGMADPEMDPEDYDVDHAFFEEHVRTPLAARVPAFEAIKPGRAWAGHYDMCVFDHNVILGPAGEVRNLLLANGFSGHGLQQAPAVGRGLAEWIIHGRYVTLDLSELGFDRLAANRPVLERNVI
jgi:FAD-dependent oxidoreductase domain-containing protein 1